MKGTELNFILTHFHATSWDSGEKMKEAEPTGSPTPTRDIVFMSRAKPIQDDSFDMNLHAHYYWY